MQTISLCMVTKNNEETIENCLSSFNELCNEIIVVDTGSSDKTKIIANKFTKNVFDLNSADNLAAEKIFAVNKATMDYILWVEPDEILLEEDYAELKRFLENLDPSVDASSMYTYILFEDGKPDYFTRDLRLFRRNICFKWTGLVHQKLEIHGNIINADMGIGKQTQQLDRQKVLENLMLYEQYLKNGANFTPRDLFTLANELKEDKNYLRATVYYHEFLATKNGSIEEYIRACINLAECYRLLENREKEMETLLMSFKYDNPRPEVSCRIGDIYNTRKEKSKALFWYHAAVNFKLEDNGANNILKYSTWYPHLQLCVCYWELGEHELSLFHHYQSKKYAPNNAKIIFNDQFFSRFNKNNTAN